MLDFMLDVMGNSDFFDIDYLSGIDYLSDIDYIFIHLGNSYFFDYLSDNDCVAGIGYIF